MYDRGFVLDKKQKRVLQVLRAEEDQQKGDRTFMWHPRYLGTHDIKLSIGA